MAAVATTNESLEPDQVPPVQNDERLYRRLLIGGWYKSGRPRPIPQKFFMPRAWVSEERRGDYDGLSVNRAMLTDIETAATRPDTGQKVHLAEFGVSDVQQVGLTVVPKPLVNDRSHAVIPELNSNDRRDLKKEARMEEWAIALRDRAILVYEAPDK